MANTFKKPSKLKSISKDIDYIMCIDENGSEGHLKYAQKILDNGYELDEEHKFLTITGVIFKRSDYAKTYFEAEQLKNKYWKNGMFLDGDRNIAVCFHSRDIRRKNIPFDENSINRKNFLNDLTTFLDNINCKVISATIDVEKYINSKKYRFSIYHTAIHFLIERFIYATKNHKKGIIVLESRDKIRDKDILNEINNLFEYGTSKISSEEFKSKIIGIYFNKKWNSDKTHTYVGLEIVDLFSYPIYQYLKFNEENPAFSIVKKKLDKGIEKGIKIFP